MPFRVNKRSSGDLGVVVSEDYDSAPQGRLQKNLQVVLEVIPGQVLAEAGNIKQAGDGRYLKRADDERREEEEKSSMCSTVLGAVRADICFAQDVAKGHIYVFPYIII